MPAKYNLKEATAFRRRLVSWFRRQGRPLPWRRTREAYPILVSEFMLQQTQVSRVLDYWPRFLRRYPTLQHLSSARVSEVREAWAGLGYYRRAENLHRLARVVVRDMAGRIPDNVQQLQSLPGVGRYTAGAVACFAYERPAATVDTNVARVLTRVFGRTQKLDDWRWRSSRAPARRHGTSTRRSWSWGRWCAVLENRSAGCAR